MNYQAFKSISLAAFLVVFSCEDKNDASDNSPISDQVVNVTTTNVNIDDIYYNLISQSQVSVDDVWDIGIVKDTENYNMPSFVPGSVDIAVYAGLNFNSIPCVEPMSSPPPKVAIFAILFTDLFTK